MKRILKCTLLVIMFMLGINVYAATANISASKTSAYVGDTVTINVSINAAAWNLNVSGNGINGGAITGFNMEGVNQTTTKSYSLNTNSVGTYVISLKGDVSDGATDVTSDISKSVTITINPKPVTQTPATSSPKPQTNNTTSNKNQNTNTNVSSNAYLSQFRINQPGVTPGFDKNVYNYAVTVAEDVKDINVTAVTEHSKATISVTGNTNLKVGSNIITVKVIAQDKKTTKTYTINVTKTDNPERSNAYLQNIIIEDLTLSPVFSPEVFEYEIDNVDEKVDKLSISAFPVNENAKVEIVGNENLKVGENEIKIIVTSENNEVQNTYALKVVKQQQKQDIIKDNNKEKTEVYKTTHFMWEILKEKASVILLYLFTWIEFLEVVYLYEKVRKLEKKSEKK